MRTLQLRVIILSLMIQKVVYNAKVGHIEKWGTFQPYFSASVPISLRESKLFQIDARAWIAGRDI